MFVLMFIIGFALAALIFLPLLLRANRRLADRTAMAGRASTNPPAQRRPNTGGPKHAADTPRNGASATGSGGPGTSSTGTGGNGSGPATAPEQNRPAVAGIDEDTQPDLWPVTPRQRTSEPIAIPILPTDLFEKHFEAKFNRSRQRLARMRAELDKE